MKILLGVLLALCLTGCAAPNYETLSDTPDAQVSVSCGQILLDLPGEWAAPTLQEAAQGTQYDCDGYTVSVQTLQSGDLDRSLYAITGYHRENLQIITTQKDGLDRYDCVFTTTGEQGLQVGRCCVLDDGNYHYAVTTLAPEESAHGVQQEWSALYQSFRIGQVQVSTGS